MAQGTTTNGAGANTGRIENKLLADMYDLSPYGYYGLTPEQQNVDSYRGSEPGREAIVAKAGGAAPGQKQGLINMAQMLTKNKNMQVSKAGIPYKYIVPPVNPQEDPGYLRPPTQQDIEYAARLKQAQGIKESGIWPLGIDPTLAEQRMTASERQIPRGERWEKDITGPLRAKQYGPTMEQRVETGLHNMGDFLKKGYTETLGSLYPLFYGPGGKVYNLRHSAPDLKPYEASLRRNLLEGRGTPLDREIMGERAEAEFRNKYWNTPAPEPRKQNIYDELGMPQIGQSRSAGKGIPLYLTRIGKSAEMNLGPPKTSPPGSEWGLPAGALELQGLTPHLSDETRDLILSGKVPVQDLPLNIQEYIKNTIEKPQTIFASPYGPEEEEKGKKKETFNLLKLLLGLLGLPLKLLGLGGGLGDKDEEEAKPKSKPKSNDLYNQMMQQRQNNAYYRQQLQSLMSRPTSVSSASTTGK